MSALSTLARGLGIGPGAVTAPDPWPGWFTPPQTDELIVGAGAGTLDRAVGVPALLGVILRTGQGVGMMPRKVYRLAADGSREQAADTRQWGLLHDRPSSESTPSPFSADLAVSLAGTGKAFVRKIKSADGRVLELIVEDARQWKARRSGGTIVFDSVRDKNRAPLTSRDLIYVRGLALNGSVEPLSPIAAHRLGITATAMGRQMFERRFYENDGRPGVLLVGPDGMTPAEAGEWLDVWDERHAGVEQSHRTGVIGGGFQVTTLPVTLADAQFVEAAQWTAAQAGAVYAMPKAFLNLAEQSPTDADWRFWVTFGLGWITTAIDQAFNADADLFPAGERLFAETVTEALLKPDIRNRYEAYKAARQAGWMTSNEIRRLENLPPHPDGDVLQVIPVGGGEPRGQEASVATEFLSTMIATATGEESSLPRRVMERAKANGHESPVGV